jgi:tripartite-type tricarboxylate transporter receptor subunit TctC
MSGIMHGFLVCSLGGVAVAFGSGAALAQNFPTKPIRIIVPYAPGGTSDILSRLTGVEITKAWGQQVIVENRPGANGNLGAELVAKAVPDGYTLLLCDVGALSISPSLYKLTFDPAKDFAPVTMIAYSPHLLVVHPSLPVKTTKELIALAKARPGQLNFAASGIGGAPHLAGVEFEQRAGTKWAYIPYKGGAHAIQELAGGQADFMLNGMLATYPHVNSGKLRLIAVSSKARYPSIPDVPTIGETLAGFESGSWQGVLAPAGTPRDLVMKLSAEFIRVVSTPEMKEKLGAQGAIVATMTPEQFQQFIVAEKARWAKVVSQAGLKLE